MGILLSIRNSDADSFERVICARNTKAVDLDKAYQNGYLEKLEAVFKSDYSHVNEFETHIGLYIARLDSVEVHYNYTKYKSWNGDYISVPQE